VIPQARSGRQEAGIEAEAQVGLGRASSHFRHMKPGLRGSDLSQLENFKAAAKENGETAIRVEPGCLAFNLVSEKENPSRVRFFEIYTNADAFKAHLETAHFKKYAETTKDMVKSRKRIESVPITLNVKGK
jgi:quinol monooxygenase YgiN